LLVLMGTHATAPDPSQQMESAAHSAGADHTRHPSGVVAHCCWRVPLQRRAPSVSHGSPMGVPSDAKQALTAGGAPLSESSTV
jgi:hypothetical protein